MPARVSNKNRPTIVWIHGVGLSGSSWPSDYPGLKPDLPGHGAASTIADPSVGRFADTIEAMLPDRFALVGHSLGGMVALELAARHGHRVSALVLVEAMPTYRLATPTMMAARSIMSFMRVLGPRGIARLSRLAGPELVQNHLKQQLSHISRRCMRDALEAVKRYDGRPLLSQITAPTLIVIGDRIKCMAQGAQIFADGLADASVTKIPGGHMLYVEESKAVLETVLGFIDGHV